jgi:LPS-assembly protein
MKNKIVYFFLFLLTLSTTAKTEIFTFDTKKLEILTKDNIILGGKGIVTSSNGTKVFADKFEYFKNTGVLKSYGSGKVINELENIEIDFDNAEINGFDNTIKAYGNIVVFDKTKNFSLITESIFYDHDKKEINSSDNTKILDSIGNTFIVSNFFYEINKDIIKLNDLELIDVNNNILKSDIAFINIKSGKLIGKDIFIELKNLSINSDNEPRIKGKTVEINNEFTKIDKGVFTTCKRRDNCPPWELSSKKIVYDKKKQIINYEDAILKVYDLPIMYFPKFFHPSPDVKRKSGFLIPSIQSSQSSGNYFSAPYFYAINENKDATFYPRLFKNDKILLQTEYRQANKDTNHIIDFSYFKNNKKNKSKNHLFYNLVKENHFKNFEKSKIILMAQQTSSDTYLRKNKIKSDIDFNENVLDNSLDINLFSKDLSLDLNSSIYEDLGLPSSDRYEYVFTKINLSKKIDNKTDLNGNFFFNSEILSRNYNTNNYINQIYNEFNFRSNTNQSKFGILKDHQFIFKNLNSKNQNTNYKDDGNIFYSGIYQFNSSFPLVKINGDSENIFEPKFSLKIAPNFTKDSRNEENKIDINNIYSINRFAAKNSTEGGISLAYGGDYSIFNKSKKILDIQIANNLRFKKNDDIVNQNQLGEKTSNFFGKLNYNPIENFETEYNFTIKNNLKQLNEENLLTTFKLKKLVTTFDYLNQNVTSLNNTYISNKTSYLMDKNSSLSFSTRKNKTKDLTEYYNFMYQYKNDCLVASIEYNKDFYNDRDVQQNENLVFKLTIIPVGETSTPNFID